MKKTTKIFLIIIAVLILLFIRDCSGINLQFEGKSKDQIKQELLEYNIILPSGDFSVQDLPFFSSKKYIYLFRNFNLKRNYNEDLNFDISRAIKTTYFNKKIEKYIYDTLINLYIIDEYVYKQEIGNDFDKIKKIVDEYLLEIEQNLNIEDNWDVNVIIDKAKINENKDKFKLKSKCYSILYKKELDKKECSNINEIKEDKENLGKMYKKYILKETNYKEIDWSKYFDGENVYPYVEITIDNDKISINDFSKMLEIFKNKYLNIIRENYNMDKMIILFRFRNKLLKYDMQVF